MKNLSKFYLIFFATFLYAFADTNAQIVVIANKSVNVQSINKNTLENLYTMHSNELGSQKVKLFFLNEESKTTSKFLSTMGMSFLEIKKIWLKAKLTGNGTPPEVLTTSEAMVNKIMSTQGAIGFIDKNLVNDNLKILFKID